jgi:hypothetical protein
LRRTRRTLGAAGAEMKPFDVFGEAFSAYYLERVFPEAREFRDASSVDRETMTRARRLMREAYRTLALRQTASSVLSQLIRPIGELLGWRLGEPETAQTILSEDEPAGNPVVADGVTMPIRVFCAAPEDSIDATPQGRHRRYALTAIVERALEATQTPYAILANRHELRIYRSRSAGASGSVVFDLSALAEQGSVSDDAWRLFFALLRAQSLQVRPTVLDQVVERGRSEMVGVGKALGTQVRQAVEIFVRGLYASPNNFEQLPRATDTAGLARLYAETLRILYRCLFILYAEARGLVPVDLPIYRESYGLSGAAHLHHAGVAARLRATFELLRRGVDLGNGERVPAFGGSIFALDQTALVEGLAWDDRVILAMLRKLVLIDGPRGQVPVSYRELDEERLGSIYEGLLMLSLRVADEPMSEIDFRGRILVLAPAQLAGIDLNRNGGAATEQTNGLFSEASGDGTEADDTEDAQELAESAPAVQSNARARRRATVLRDIIPGEPYLASSSGRKETASYYTARDLVDFLVRETVDPLAAQAEPATILSLRVLDPAMGSGHFLVGALRRLADHLVAAYRQLEERDGEEALPPIVRAALDDERELLRVCRQLVAVHCLYGVDKNPLAIDLARVALWLATAAAGHPLSFLDHRVKCGDSLLGLTPERTLALDDLRPRRRRGSAQTELLHAGATMVTETDLRRGLNRALEQTFRQLAAFRAIVDDELQDFELKREMAASVERSMQPLRTLHAARVGRLLKDDELYQPMLGALRDFATLGYLSDSSRDGIKPWIEMGEASRAFCWEIEFPEVFYRSLDDQRVEKRHDAGFDVVIGNPPWDKLKLERKRYYERYDPLIADYQGTSADARIKAVNQTVPNAQANFEIALEEQRAYARMLADSGRYQWQRYEIDGQRTGGDPDCFKFFTELAWSLAREGGHVGLVTPAAFTSDDGTTGLRHLALEHSALETLIVFENRRKLFEIDSRFKFQVLHLRRGGRTNDFEAAFWVHDTDILRKSKRDRAHESIVVRTDDVRRTSQDRLAILEVRSERDLRIARQLLDIAPPLGKTDDSWPLSFGRELDMSQDRKLFHTAVQLEAEGGDRDGDRYVKPDGSQYIPLREGRMIQAFDANAKRYVSGEGRSAVWSENGWPKAPIEPHYWVNVEELPEEYRRTDRRLYWCDVTGPTNERTAMAAVVRGVAVSGHSLNVLYTRDTGAGLLNGVESVFNSFCFDWYIRLSVGQHMSMNYVLPVPFLRSVPLRDLDNFVEVVSSPSINYIDRANARAEIDAAVGLGYSLSYADLSHILDSFPLLDRGEPALTGETKSTITRDLVLAAYCRQSGTHDPEHADRAATARVIGALGYVAEPLRKQIGVVHA